MAHQAKASSSLKLIKLKQVVELIIISDENTIKEARKSWRETINLRLFGHNCVF
jgi:hypothetical protein